MIFLDISFLDNITAFAGLFCCALPFCRIAFCCWTNTGSVGYVWIGRCLGLVGWTDTAFLLHCRIFERQKTLHFAHFAHSAHRTTFWRFVLLVRTLPRCGLLTKPPLIYYHPPPSILTEDSPTTNVSLPFVIPSLPLCPTTLTVIVLLIPSFLPRIYNPQPYLLPSLPSTTRYYLPTLFVILQVPSSLPSPTSTNVLVPTILPCPSSLSPPPSPSGLLLILTHFRLWFFFYTTTMTTTWTRRRRKHWLNKNMTIISKRNVRLV